MNNSIFKYSDELNLKNSKKTKILKDRIEFLEKQNRALKNELELCKNQFKEIENKKEELRLYKESVEFELKNREESIQLKFNEMIDQWLNKYELLKNDLNKVKFEYNELISKYKKLFAFTNELVSLKEKKISADRHYLDKYEI